MAEQPLIEIREWGQRPRRMMLDRPILVGRECPGVQLADDKISRQHLRLLPGPTGLSVVDLGSRNGTTLNGVALTGRAVLAPGDVLRFGRSEIIVVHAPVTEAGTEDEHDATRLIRLMSAAPPPVPAAQAARRPVIALAERILDIDPTGERQLFPAYTELRRHLQRGNWRVLRVFSVAAYLGVVVLMFVRPADGLFVLFGVIVPLWPILFLVAPGLWRNICPLSASNQAPRVLGFTLARNPPEWLRRYGFLIASGLFFGIAGSRLAGLDRNGPLMGVVLLAVIAGAFIGGYVLKGKSGWCSSICPLLPLQRAYGQTPYVTVANSHCESCVGCAKNCYDFKPRAAYQADVADAEPRWSTTRLLFAAALPGFILGFFLMRTQADVMLAQRYTVLGLCLLASVGLFHTAEALLPVSPSMLAVGWSAMALNIFYWFSGPVLTNSLRQVTGVDAGWLRWPISVIVAALTLLWIARTRVSELQFAWSTGARSEPVLLAPPKRIAQEPGAHVRFGADGNAVVAESGCSLLEIAERNGQRIEAGCRMGVCGADPVAVLDGADCLSAPQRDELNTLRRLGHAATTRMACCARVSSGTVTVSLTPEPGDGGAERPDRYDRSIMSVVVIGNGIAGVTAADFVRRGHPDCEIHLVGQEPHALYNRMGISRLVYGRSAMKGLYLLPEHWYDEHRVTAWLNTVATGIDLRGKRVSLGTGEALPYDRLILAMGASATLPSIDGVGRPGSFVLREAGDAMRIRAYAQQNHCRRAVVAGAGLLGLEAAYSLSRLGLRVSVLEKSDRLLSRVLDARGSELVGAHFAKAGITIVPRSRAVRVLGSPAVTAVETSGGVLPCELFLSATGITPNTELARNAGVQVGKGVLVDDRLQTSVPGVFAAGDVAEHRGQVFGLWPIATQQAQAAAVNALGGNELIPAELPATILKGVDLELFSIGRVEATTQFDEVIVVENPDRPSYRRLILSGDRVVGGIVLGHHPGDVAAVQQAAKTRVLLDGAAKTALRSGDWQVLSADQVLR